MGFLSTEPSSLLHTDTPNALTDNALFEAQTAASAPWKVRESRGSPAKAEARARNPCTVSIRLAIRAAAHRAQLGESFSPICVSQREALESKYWLSLSVELSEQS